MNKAIKIRLFPTKEQEILFYKHINCQRYVYNWALSINNELYKKNKKKYSCNELGKMLTKHKKDNIWLNEVSNATLITILAIGIPGVPEILPTSSQSAGIGFCSAKLEAIVPVYFITYPLP